MEDIKKLIMENMPLSEEAWKVAERSIRLKSEESVSTMQGHDSMFPATVAKILNKLESTGSRVTSVEDNDDLETRKITVIFREVVDALWPKNIDLDMMVESAAIEGFISEYRNQDVLLHSIVSCVDSNSFEYHLMIRGKW